ncbi:hypothetical protein [Candidatus Enterococcus murrayae]|uniref:Integral membrane protein n=1 Tax=Candidatus Enterococcus murrayae TaxID=2815321 RepID=A0ABS3HCV8_9ENTE|nr:hypothetical protein [Enterococcus sp. MJM16]MBO0451276.1 hypothetical protein [Enterococcus sp. MJM16]
MKKMGAVIFNVLVASWVLFTIYVVMASIWFSAGMLAISPLLVIGAAVLNLQSFFIINFILSVCFSLGMIVMLPVMIKGTKAVQSLISEYFVQMSHIWHS